MARSVKLCSFQSVAANQFRAELESAGLKKPSVCISAVEGLEYLKQTGGVDARRNASGTSSTPVAAMGTLIKIGMAAFNRQLNRYELTPDGEVYHAQLKAKGLVDLALDCRRKINAFAKEVAA
jgi:hypothetical protein